LITAKEVQIVANQWHLKTGTVTLFEKANSFPLAQSFDEKTVVMNEDLADIKSTTNSSDVMSLSTLKKFINKK
jgi:hypothetical protein